MLKNFSIALAIVAVVFIGVKAVPASALTGGDVQAQIQKLMAQISELTAQLERLRSSAGYANPSQVYISPMPVPPSPLRVCKLIARDLAQGAQGDDVRSLQEFLREQKFLAVEPTGYFGQMTADAVRKWQAQEGVQAVGAFGPLSRERIKIWCGGVGGNLTATPTRGDAPLAVTFTMKFDNGGIGVDSYTINFGDGSSEPVDASSEGITSCYGDCPTRDPRIHVRTHTYASNGTYTAVLIHYSNPCVKVPGCMAPVSQEVIGKVPITVGPIACTKEYKPVCGSKPIVCITTPCNPIPTNYGNRCEMNADGASFLYEGQCRSENPADDPQCKRWRLGGYCGGFCSRDTPGGTPNCAMPQCMEAQSVTNVPPAQCMEYFNSSGNKPPVISGFSGPTTLAVNVTGTWTIQASDPENGTLSYNIRWGDEFNPGPGVYAAVEAAQWLQTTTFTHSYANPGAYTITILVRDSAGQTAQTTTTVRVIGNVACTMEYAPVCGVPYSYCPPGAACQPSVPQTYSNRCVMGAAGATFLYEGQCTL